MESQRFEKTGGEGVPGAGLPLTDSSEPLLCQYRDARGRGCRMPVSALSDHLADQSDLDISAAGLCTFHARRLRERHRAGQTVAAELLASITDFSDAPSVNRFLGNLARMVASRRIPRRDAVALAYISQLILNSQTASGRNELQNLQLEELRRKLEPPPRVIWDIPRRRTEPEQTQNSGTEVPGANSSAPTGTPTGRS